MHRFAWKNRVTLGLGIGIASLALVAGCADDDEPEDDLGIADPVATEAMDSDPTEAATTEAETTTDTEEGDPAEGEDVTVNITPDGLMVDGTMGNALALTAGSTVTFMNDGAETVNVTTDDGAIDEDVDAGGSFDFTFDEAGTWALSVDGEEMGTIVVE